MPGFDVVVVGSANRDVSVETPAFPQPGETVLGTAVRVSTGGKGANQAAAAALAGARTALLARLGDDDAGRDVRSALGATGATGVDCTLLTAVPGTSTGTAAITVAGSENTIVVVPGANHVWPPGWPDETVGAVLGAAHVVLAQLEIPLEVAVAAAARATRFVLNASPATTLPDELLARCDVLLVNEHELAAAAGTTGELTAAHAALRERGVGAVVTTLGARGVVVTDADGTSEIASPPSEAVDTTGAGDAFAGVLCAKLAAGLPLREATRWAAAAGSYAARREGTLASYPDATTLAALVEPGEPPSHPVP